MPDDHRHVRRHVADAARRFLAEPGRATFDAFLDVAQGPGESDDEVDELIDLLTHYPASDTWQGQAQRIEALLAALGG
jgi:hypothetical protein